VHGSLGRVTLQFDSIETLTFITTTDGAGTDLSIACDLRGTLILTEAGEVAVGDLAIGDPVVTLSGEARPIHAVLPICIEARALDDGVPARDLWVSPGHSRYIDGVLMQSEHLLNGAVFRAALFARAEHALDTDPDLHLVVDGEIDRPTPGGGDVYRPAPKRYGSSRATPAGSASR
jgi:Hint domain